MTPLLLLMLVAIADYGRAFYTYIMITNAAREGARYGSTHPSLDQEPRIRATVTFYTEDNGITIEDPENQVVIAVSGTAGRQTMRVRVTTEVPTVLGSFVGVDNLTVSGWGDMPLLADRPS